MKLAGFLLLLAGWIIALTALVLLRSSTPQTGFVLAGIGVEIEGLVLVVRAHMAPRRKRDD